MSHQEYRVDDVHEAIAMATDFKRSGTYDWFRGQLKPWPPHSTALRVKLRDNDDWQEVLQKPLLRFLRWLSITPGMESLVGDENAILAVAQHYGLPTDFIDFTTDPAVAGFLPATHQTRLTKRRNAVSIV